jgi:hypothetical protein
MHLGTVEWLSDETGEGCIVPDEGTRIFSSAHRRCSLAGRRVRGTPARRPGDTYELVVCETVSRAENVRRLG